MSDGSTGELSSFAGRLAGGVGVRVGPYEFDFGGGGGYEREVHLVRDASGNPVQLFVTENYVGSISAQCGSMFLGTGGTAEASQVRSVTSVTEFDLADPAVRATYGGLTDHGELATWAQEHRLLGGSTVSAYEGAAVSARASLLFSGELNTDSGSATLTRSQYRPPGSAEFHSIVGDMRPPDGMVRQVYTDSNGNVDVVFTPTF